MHDCVTWQLLVGKHDVTIPNHDHSERNVTAHIDTCMEKPETYMFSVYVIHQNKSGVKDTFVTLKRKQKFKKKTLQHECNLCQVFTVRFSTSGTLSLGSNDGDCLRQPPKHCSPPTHASSNSRV